MNQIQNSEGDPPGQIIRIAPYEPRDARGRTLDLALFEDQAQREKEWTEKLRRTYRPLAILDNVFAVAVTVLLLSAVLCYFASVVPVLSGALELAGHLLLACIAAVVGYVSVSYAVLKPWMRQRLNQVKAEAQQHGVMLDEDPMAGPEEIPLDD